MTASSVLRAVVRSYSFSPSLSSAYGTRQGCVRASSERCSPHVQFSAIRPSAQRSWTCSASRSVSASSSGGSATSEVSIGDGRYCSGRATARNPPFDVLDQFSVRRGRQLCKRLHQLNQRALVAWIGVGPHRILEQLLGDGAGAQRSRVPAREADRNAVVRQSCEQFRPGRSGQVADRVDNGFARAAQHGGAPDRLVVPSSRPRKGLLYLPQDKAQSFVLIGRQ